LRLYDTKNNPKWQKLIYSCSKIKDTINVSVLCKNYKTAFGKDAVPILISCYNFGKGGVGSLKNHYIVLCFAVFSKRYQLSEKISDKGGKDEKIISSFIGCGSRDPVYWSRS